MILLVFVFAMLCVGTFMVQRNQRIRQCGIWLNIILIVMASGLFGLWYFLSVYYPAVTITEHWVMVLISLLGFLSMFLSTVTAFRNREGFCRVALVIASIGLGLLHFLDIVVSIPVS